MKILLAGAIALNVAASGPATSGPELDRAYRNYSAIAAGQRQLSDLTPRERLELIEFDRWLRGHGGIRESETQQQCKDRLASQSPTQLEEALLDLKCSQRPVR